jgi:hypothetical protein
LVTASSQARRAQSGILSQASGVRRDARPEVPIGRYAVAEWTSAMAPAGGVICRRR